LSFVTVYTKRRFSNARVLGILLVDCNGSSLSVSLAIYIFSFNTRNVALISRKLKSSGIVDGTAYPVLSFIREICVLDI